MIPGSIPFYGSKFAGQLRKKSGENLALMASRAEGRTLLIILAFRVDEHYIGVDEAQAELDARFGSSPVPSIASILAGYSPPWWAPWRCGSLRHAVRACKG